MLTSLTFIYVFGRFNVIIRWHLFVFTTMKKKNECDRDEVVMT